MRTIKTCKCCGADFWAGSISAKWCSSRCSMRAYQRRRRGVPEADWAIKALSPVHQPTLVEDDDTDDLPAVWRLPPAGTEERIWQGTAIQRRDADGFVNATQMAKANGKHLPHYMANDRTREYLEALSGSVGIPTDRLVATTMTGPNDLRGTWIHPRLAIDLARWISPAFAVWMDGWFLESLSPALSPARPSLEPGVHVVAASERGAAMIWHEVITTEVTNALGRLNPAHRHHRSLPLAAHYTFTPTT